jgi:hypothetical protein
MKWLLDLALGALPNVWPYLAAAFGGLVLFLTGRSSGAAKLKRKQAEATVKGVQDGAKGAAKADADLRAGKTPQQIKEENDAKWR